jgi:DNA-binding HxlR family transcriptional regulator
MSESSGKSAGAAPVRGGSGRDGSGRGGSGRGGSGRGGSGRSGRDGSLRDGSGRSGHGGSGHGGSGHGEGAEAVMRQPLAKATALLGRPWTLLIVDALAGSPRRFSELTALLPRISTNLLTERLRQLQSSGVVERDTGSMPEFVITYRLTELGSGLSPIVSQLEEWGARLG